MIVSQLEIGFERDQDAMIDWAAQELLDNRVLHSKNFFRIITRHGGNWRGRDKKSAP